MAAVDSLKLLAFTLILHCTYFQLSGSAAAHDIFKCVDSFVVLAAKAQAKYFFIRFIFYKFIYLLRLIKYGFIVDQLADIIGRVLL